MSIYFVCECGRHYTVGDEHAGKKLRCKQCGRSSRLPTASASEPEIDAYGLSEESTPASVLRPLDASRRPGNADDAPSETGPGAKSKKSKGARLLEALPGRDDLIFPILGVVSLILTGVIVVSGGLFAVIWLLFVALATPVCLLWAGISALKAAHERETGAFWPLFGAFGASGVCYVTFLASGPNKMVPLTAAVAAVGGFSRFIARERRFHTYTRSVALGIFSLFLLASLTILVGVVRQRMAALGLTNDPLPQASAPPMALPNAGVGKPAAFPLVEARRGLRTVLTRHGNSHQPAPEPPPEVFSKVRYPSPAGSLVAYLTPPPTDGAKHPVIIWITGGDSNTIDDVWSPADPGNDQTASAYRKAGIMMMFPSLRGGNDNPGDKEGFLGEVDDVLAAADYLARQEYVDPARIYLGGHSTGGTLVMLVAASTDRFRAVFSFGPVHTVEGYGNEYLPFDVSNSKEVQLRSPGFWLNAIRCPTFVFEGTQEGNILSLRAMARSTSNPFLHFYAVRGASHFSILAPTNQNIAAKILGDESPAVKLQFTEDELSRPFGG